jgi:hypothetical protein|nr:MAG TPA: hypothetical protein [Caudoviricetes sp.]
MKYILEYEKERGGTVFTREYESRDEAIRAGKDRFLFRATVYQVNDNGQRFFVMRKIRG